MPSAEPSGTAVAPSEPQRGIRRLPWWMTVVLVGLVLILYFPVLRELVRDWWNNPDFSHGFLVPVFSAWLVWQARGRLRQLPRRASWSGAFTLLAAVALLFAGVFGAERFTTRFSLLVLLAGLIALFLGWNWFRALWFPWAFLLLMIPIPAILFNQITFPLQLLASKLASAALPVFGVPVLREGNVLSLPSMQLEVAEACSGIRSLVTLGTLAIVVAYLLETKLWKRVLVAVASVPIAVAANSSRIVLTGLMVQYWDPATAPGFFHEFSGWLIFIVALLMLFAFHGLLRLLPWGKVDLA